MEKRKISFRLPKTVTYKEARKTISDIVRQIEEERELEASDIPQLHRMATAYNAYIDCVRVVSEKGLTMKNIKGGNGQAPGGQSAEGELEPVS